MGGASCGFIRRAVRLARVTTWGKASEHWARATWVTYCCARAGRRRTSFRRYGLFSPLAYEYVYMIPHQTTVGQLLITNS